MYYGTRQWENPVSEYTNTLELHTSINLITWKCSKIVNEIFKTGKNNLIKFLIQQNVSYLDVDNIS